MTTESRRLAATGKPARRRINGTLATMAILVAGSVPLWSVPAVAQVVRAPTFVHAPTVFGPAVPGGPVYAGPAVVGGPAYGSYRWPVRGPVIRPFEEPANPYSAGHRGIDIAAPFGTAIRAPADGVVSFAGTVAGSQFISIDHPDGIRTSYSWVSAISVTEGQAVTVGEVIGRTGQGHPGSAQSHLHFSARLNGVYIDPMLLLGGGNLDEVIHLAPAPD
jgi:murein DD-endopeptidase MepM/ murein hydrolase activator NlpD